MCSAFCLWLHVLKKKKTVLRPIVLIRGDCQLHVLKKTVLRPMVLIRGGCQHVTCIINRGRALEDDMHQCACRLAILAAPDDHWFPEAQYKRCRTLLPLEDLQWDERQQHAFCVNSPNSLAAALSVERWTRQALAHLPAAAE